jgi:hypothetical protein
MPDHTGLYCLCNLTARKQIVKADIVGKINIAAQQTPVLDAHRQPIRRTHVKYNRRPALHACLTSIRSL